MAIDYQKLKNWPFRPIEQTYAEKESILYALGLGFGADPTDRRQLDFVYEEGLKALPTMAVVSPGRARKLMSCSTAASAPGSSTRPSVWI